MQEHEKIINRNQYPLQEIAFRDSCKNILAKNGVLLLPNFLKPNIVKNIIKEGKAKKHLAYYCRDTHNVYLTKPKAEYAPDHVYNRQIISSKGCITDDQISHESHLRILYNNPVFQEFLCHTLGINALYPYADPLSSINIHYADAGQELGWHFDNSSFAITLLLQKPESGGEFHYVKDLRNADIGDFNFQGVQRVLDGEEAYQTLNMQSGCLVLFRGRNSMHRVSPTIGDTTRILCVMAYNTKPDVALSESARMTFYGRIG